MEKINQNNRKVLLASSKEVKDAPLISLYWDRIDKALFVIDEDGEYHRIYPSFIEGLPTIAAQLQKQKEGYVVSEIPVSNTMTAEFIDIKTIKLTFKNKVYSSTLYVDSASVYELPEGCIFSGKISNSGSKYASGQYELIVETRAYTQSSGEGAIVNVISSDTIPTDISLIEKGTGYMDESNVPVTGGSGVNLTLDIFTSDGGVQSVVLNNPGSGYSIQDRLTIDTGNGDAIITVNDVSGGEIKEVTIYDGGSNYQVDDLLVIDGGDGLATFLVEEVVTIAQIVSFEKTNYGTEQDTISKGVILARGLQGALYNSVTETYYNDSDYSSPANTQWNSIYIDDREGFSGFNDTSNVTSRKYGSFYSALNGSVGENVLNTQLVMCDQTTGYYWKFQFASWTSGGKGGGFSYTRELISVTGEVRIPTEGAIKVPGEALERPIAGARLTIDSVESDEEKTNTVYLILSEDAGYSTYYGITVTDIYNLAKEPSTVNAMALTIDQPQYCSPIKSIYFDAYGSGPVSVLPLDEITYKKMLDPSYFIYYRSGKSWSEFLKYFQEGQVQVPKGVVAPDTVYAYYPLEGKKYLFNDAAWIIGIVGSELEYDSSYYYNLYTLELIEDYIQLTPAGSSSAKCGVSDWGGEWGSDILEFRINRA
jgi:hypothetical protein